MIRPPRFYRKYVTISLYRIKKKIPPFVLFLLFILCCFMFPFGAMIKLQHPGFIDTFKIAWEIGSTNFLNGLIVFTILLSYLSIFTFFLNSAFVFLRALCGYDVRRNSSILKWAYYKVKKLKAKNT